MTFVALLDANVLYPACIRDTLLIAIEYDLYRGIWTEQILNEMARALIGNGKDPVRVNRTVNLMLANFPEALVEGYRDLIEVMKNHEKDRHILAAAVRAGAAVIVTENSKHFPPHTCDQYSIDVQSVDEFLCHLWYLSPEAMVLVLKEQAETCKNPPKSIREVLETIGKSAPTFSATVLGSGMV